MVHKAGLGKHKAGLSQYKAGLSKHWGWEEHGTNQQRQHSDGTLLSLLTWNLNPGAEERGSGAAQRR